jgi:hypothetical protein
MKFKIKNIKEKERKAGKLSKEIALLFLRLLSH